MTAQMHEILILEGIETSMAFCPPLPENHPKLKRLNEDEAMEQARDSWIFSTACWRQYVGTWELKDGRFYLTDIDGIYRLEQNEPLFADWVTGVLRIPEGEQLHYVHMGFGSVYEYERHIKLVDGLVVDERIIDNRDRDFDTDQLGWDSLPGSENKFDGDDL